MDDIIVEGVKTIAKTSKTPVLINADIIKQGDVVRKLKEQKSAKGDIDSAVKLLLALKADYKALTNTDWKPGCTPPEVSSVPMVNNVSSKISTQKEITYKVMHLGWISLQNSDASTFNYPNNSKNSNNAPGEKTPADLNDEISKQGNHVRKLKEEKAAKADIDSAVKTLLALKADYKMLTKTDWKPGCVPPVIAPTGDAGDVESLSVRISARGKECHLHPSILFLLQRKYYGYIRKSADSTIIANFAFESEAVTTICQMNRWYMSFGKQEIMSVTKSLEGARDFDTGTRITSRKRFIKIIDTRLILEL
ncbi:hypothetical protein NQ317_011421 [Molorchus minor]|uniref:WHEP-TRS domain-containing protein n=1 Tax=Molorchus minor TaxID=1323400 RepID=A0ABQ9JPP3_9CUCU|nr:hypothetical protein NQ317_011421 [Molorchus minor]